LAVLVPCLVLGVLALRAADRESAYVERRLELSLLAEVDSIGRRAEEVMDGIASGLEGDAGFFFNALDGAPSGCALNSLSDWAQRNPAADVPFLIDDGELLFPEGLSAERKDTFLAYFGDFLEKGSRLPIYEGLARIYRRDAGDERRLMPDLSEGIFDISAQLQGSSARETRARDVEHAEETEAQALSEVAELAGSQAEKAQKNFAKNAGMERQIAENLIASDPRAREDAFRQASDEGFEIMKRNVAPATPEQRQTEKAEHAENAGFDLPTGDGRSRTVAMSRSFDELKSESDGGIIPYFSDGGLELLFWAKGRAGGREIVTGCSLRMDEVKASMADALRGLVSDVRILAMLDENGTPIVPDSSALTAFNPDWQRPWAAREISPILPRWEVGAWLADPVAFESRVRFARIAVWVMVVALFTVIAAGGAVVIRLLSSELRTAAQKTTFVANVSHELKTPLTSIKLFAELLLSGRQTDESRRAEYLKTMISEIDRLSRLVEGVLTFSRRGKDAVPAPAPPVDLSGIVRETLSRLEPGLAMKGFDVRFEGDEPVMVSGNREVLAQIVMNLVSNAEKYSAETREIYVICRRAGGLVLLDIADRGIGVDPRIVGKIFQEFFRGDDSLSAMVSGAGLGLSIARDIARRHGGDVTYAPREGGGSVFTLSLPIYETRRLMT
jgi:signal transduction histidine kinase